MNLFEGRNTLIEKREKQEAVRKLMETSGSFPYQDLGLMIFVAHSKVQEGGHECLLHHGSQGEAGHSQQLHRPNILLRVLMEKHQKNSTIDILYERSTKPGTDHTCSIFLHCKYRTPKP
ncbi:uncharacterized protein [Miscanthus floridulus]|uniref:uncharacterized protein n=1 Tax=Miscanthus floridulus TaxID=154761 RepID=UPI00345AD77B